MKKLLLMLLIVSIATISNGSKKDSPGTLTNHFVKAHPLISDTSNAAAQIPVIAILAIPENLTNLSRYKQLRASGITGSYYHFSNANAMQAALDMGQKAGIKLFVACPELISDPEATVRRFMNHPALAGYFLSDEPSSKAFGTLRLLVKRIKAIDNNHICYVNLLPNFAQQSQLGADSYQDYLSLFVKQVPVQILSFDNYPIIGNTKKSVRGDWYKNLELISAESKRSNIPFWAFALTVSHSVYPVPTLGALKLQVYSDLAYGAQGIQYFSYWTPGGKVNFHNGPISPDGKQTDVYDKIQQVNKEIKGLSGVFLGAKMVSVGHTGDDIPQGTKPLVKLPNAIASLKTEGLGALVSVMNNNGKSYLVIVNRDFTDSMDLTIKCNNGVSRILKDGSSIPQDTNINKVKVDAGDVTVYSWSDIQKKKISSKSKKTSHRFKKH